MQSDSPILAVLWDMDGTLIDSEPYWMAAEKSLAEEFGGQWGSDIGRSLVGLNLFDAAEILRREFRIESLSNQQIIDQMTAVVVEKLRAEMPWRPGALEMLEQLHSAGIKNALVTGSMRRMATLVASAAGEDCFSVVVAGDDVQNGKPHPEPYLKALQALSIDAVSAIAIEDSPTGMASAIAAGVFVVGVRNLVDLEPGESSVVIGSLNGLSASELTGLAVS